MTTAGWRQAGGRRWVRVHRSRNYIALFDGRSEDEIAGYIYWRDWTVDSSIKPMHHVSYGGMIVNEHELNCLLAHMKPDVS